MSAAWQASPEAISRAFAYALVREHGDDASRLADIVVAEVQNEMRASAARRTPSDTTHGAYK